RMSFKLMRRLGMNAPRAAHARLYVNDEYMGLYMIVENVDEAFVRDRFHENGFLYNYQYPKENPTYRLQYRRAHVAAYCPAPFEPKTHELEPECEVIERMIRTINQAPDEEFGEQIGKYLDMRLFLKEVAVEAYLGDSDGIAGDFGINNFYLYRHPDSE